jgi:peptidyl-prolyl cis-trans isomerase C
MPRQSKSFVRPHPAVRSGGSPAGQAPIAFVAGIAALGVALVLAGCAKQPAAAPEDEAVAVVDGKPLSRNTFEFYVKGVAGKPLAEIPAAQQQELLDNLVRGELVARDAERSGLAAEAETRAVLALSRLNVLQRAQSARLARDEPPTDAELQAEYDGQVAALPKQEYRVRHIQVATEAFATKLIERLARGARFEDLARQESMDTQSKDRGGELEWFSLEGMAPAPAFAAATRTLAKGEYTRAPVQTPYGWHVIRLEDVRDLTPPPLDTVRDRLVQIVLEKKFAAYTQGLLNGVKIESRLAPAPAAPATGPTPPAPATGPAAPSATEAAGTSPGAVAESP